MSEFDPMHVQTKKEGRFCVMVLRFSKSLHARFLAISHSKLLFTRMHSFNGS